MLKMKTIVEEGEVNRENKNLEKEIRQIYIVALPQENAINFTISNAFLLINFVENFQTIQGKQ